MRALAGALGLSIGAVSKYLRAVRAAQCCTGAYGDARNNLRLLLAANKRLNTAYLLKESFGQLRDDTSEA